MKCIIGLGNPGKKYKSTRHNVGFMVIEEILLRKGWALDKTKFNGHYAMEKVGSDKIILLEPQTFMNLSGEAIRPLMDYYDIDAEDMLLIYDDLDLPAGKIRLRQKGGHGGHNGVRSTIDHLGTKEFNRLRIGIGRSSVPMPVVDYVLGSISQEQKDDVISGIQKAADACQVWMEKPFHDVMNEFNK